MPNRHSSSPRGQEWKTKLRQRDRASTEVGKERGQWEPCAVKKERFGYIPRLEEGGHAVGEAAQDLDTRVGVAQVGLHSRVVRERVVLGAEVVALAVGEGSVEAGAIAAVENVARGHGGVAGADAVGCANHKVRRGKKEKV